MYRRTRITAACLPAVASLGSLGACSDQRTADDQYIRDHAVVVDTVAAGPRTWVVSVSPSTNYAFCLSMDHWSRVVHHRPPGPPGHRGGGCGFDLTEPAGVLFVESTNVRGP